MVFLGGAVLANIVSLHPSVRRIHKLMYHTDGGQGKYVDIQGGMGRTGRPCAGETWCKVKSTGDEHDKDKDHESKATRATFRARETGKKRREEDVVRRMLRLKRIRNSIVQRGVSKSIQQLRSNHHTFVHKTLFIICRRSMANMISCPVCQWRVVTLEVLDDASDGFGQDSLHQPEDTFSQVSPQLRYAESSCI